MEVSEATAWAAERTLGVLITIRSDGRPQSSDIVYDLDGGSFVISVTEGRAKTANLRRDPRAVLHVSDAASWSYVAFDGTVDMSPAATSPERRHLRCPGAVLRAGVRRPAPGLGRVSPGHGRRAPARRAVHAAGGDRHDPQLAVPAGRASIGAAIATQGGRALQYGPLARDAGGLS